MQYCCQHPVCAQFNNKEAKELAKATQIPVDLERSFKALFQVNVAKHYAVVGVLEMWDETLEVLEDTLPFFFKGAKEMYQKKHNQVKFCRRLISVSLTN